VPVTGVLAFHPGAVRGWRIAYRPDFGVFPVEPEVAAVVADAVRALDQAGAAVQEVSLPIGHGQRELSELWCRLIIPINVATFETFKRSGPDLLGDHRSDFPPEYLRWIEEGPVGAAVRPLACFGSKAGFIG
jgi:amidase